MANLIYIFSFDLTKHWSAFKVQKVGICRMISPDLGGGEEAELCRVLAASLVSEGKTVPVVPVQWYL